MAQQVLLNELEEGLVLNQSLVTSGHVSTGSSSQEVLGSLYHPECFGQLGSQAEGWNHFSIPKRSIIKQSAFIILPVIVRRQEVTALTEGFSPERYDPENSSTSCASLHAPAAIP